MADHAHWRIRVTANNGNATTMMVGVQMQNSGGINQCSGGTSSASSSQAGHTPDKGFVPWDGDLTTSSYWQSASNQGVPSWLAYHFPSPVDIHHVTITGVRAAASMPQYITIESSDNGDDWTPEALWRDEDAWVLDGVDTRTFNINDFSLSKNTFDMVQPVIDGYSNVLNPFDGAQPLVDGYSVVLHNMCMVQALLPVFPEPPMSDTPFPGFGNSPTDPSVPAAKDPFNSALPGLSFSVHKKPLFKTNIKEAASGNEVRNAMMQYPRWDFELTYEFLEDRTGAESSLKTIMGFFLQMQGAFDTFLFKDPDDYLVSGVACGVGDGLTTGFPLLRDLGGFKELVGQVDEDNPIVIGVSSQTLQNVPVTPGPYTIAVAPGTFISDIGVKQGVTVLTRIASGVPTVNQYLVDNAGVYTFAAARQGQAMTISFNDALSAGYSIELPNQLVFDSAPAEDVVITASFQFFFPCRFVDDQMDFEKFMDKLWNLQECNFRSVIQ